MQIYGQCKRISWNMWKMWWTEELQVSWTIYLKNNEMHNVYLAAQFQIQIPDVAINLYHFTSYYCVGSIMYDFFIKKNKLGIHIISENIYNVILGALMQVWRRNKMTRARGHWKKGEHTVQGSHSDMFGPKAGGDISTSPHLLAFNKTTRSHKFTMGINNGSTVFWLVSPFSTKN